MRSNEKKFTAQQIKTIAKEYIFVKGMTYKKLAEKYHCSPATITRMMNHNLKEISKFLYKLAALKAKYNSKKNMKRFMKHK